jgi:UDP-N-acetylglucosamine 2-epimerase (non-hydrolysing)
MRSLKVVVVAGARPNFMKVAPFLKRVDARNAARGPSAAAVEALLVHTGQHYDENMSEVFFRELGIRRPDINLGVGSATHAVQTARIMTAFETVCEKEKPDWVIVVGDVNSTMACAIVCAKMGVRVAHVEAGLRSFDRTMPEEINRIITDALADLLLTPSADADDNLRREGVPPEKIRLVGNIMIDSLIANLPAARACGVLSRLGVPAGGYVYVTLHRPGNVDSPESLSKIVSGLEQLAGSLPVVFPIHPRTRKRLSDFGLTPRQNGRLMLFEPIGYHESLSLAESARLVLTDSGGLQEETTYFRTPCLTLRPTTERPVTLTLGSNRMTRLETLFEDIEQVLRGPDRIGQVPPLWDGRTAERVLDQLIACPAG